MGYFAFPFVTRLGMAGTVVASAIFGVVTYLFAFRATEEKKKELPEEEKKALARRQYWEHRGARILTNPKTADGTV